MPDIIINEKGQKVVRIDTIIFSSKRRIDWAGVDKKNIIGQNHYRGRMVIRCDQNGKNYLYDIVDIKKET